ncbi:MAG: hypothetical protein LBT89_09810 [Planctomycetaceae bacterium]|jgi:hypothetical protein|nr:hypothetical protein [Planctomycetaceae bacterium]
MKNSAVIITAVFIIVGSSLSAVCAEEAKAYSLTDFMRVSIPAGKRQPVSFDTAVVKFTDAAKKLEVDLIAAVHIGDKSYYEELNRRFKEYDAVLYELVAESGTKPDKTLVETSKNRSALSSAQNGIGRMLALDFQLSHIDYHAANMIHADLSPEDFYRRAAERGDIVQMMFNVIVLSVQKSGDKKAAKDEMKSQGRLAAAAFSPNPPLALKRFFAMELIRQADDAVLLFGGEGGSAIISDRNAAALKILKKEIKDGKKKIGIFYGGAHLPEFAVSLEKDFHLKRTATDWLPAWDLRTKH